MASLLCRRKVCAITLLGKLQRDHSVLRHWQECERLRTGMVYFMKDSLMVQIATRKHDLFKRAEIVIE